MVTFANSQTAWLALKLSGILLGDRKIIVTLYNSDANSAFMNSSSAPSTKSTTDLPEEPSTPADRNPTNLPVLLEASRTLYLCNLSTAFTEISLTRHLTALVPALIGHISFMRLFKGAAAAVMPTQFAIIECSTAKIRGKVQISKLSEKSGDKETIWMPFQVWDEFCTLQEHARILKEKARDVGIPFDASILEGSSLAKRETLKDDPSSLVATRRDPSRERSRHVSRDRSRESRHRRDRSRSASRSKHRHHSSRHHHRRSRNSRSRSRSPSRRRDSYRRY